MGRLGPGLAREGELADDAASAVRAGYVRAYDQARAAGDIEAMTDAALGLAATQTFGTFPGRVSAFLHEAYSLAGGEQRARLAIALARAWAYGYDPARAAGFAAEALAYAEAHDDPSLLAAALDWLLTVAELTEVAVATGAGALAETAMRLLAPYAGRGVVNGGGAAFAGVVSDYLYQASELLGTGDAPQWAARVPKWQSPSRAESMFRCACGCLCLR